ncbi:MAG: PfkB family carbohydrate kinase [Rubrivivax sp.]|nr:PfkB family carbohydrate kinase [Rubrivivax sp.]
MTPTRQQKAPQPVLVIGEALVDEFPDGTRVAGGAPFNQARWLAALGVPVRFVTRIGQSDAGAACVMTSARRCGLGTDGIQRDPLRPTGRVLVSLGNTGPSYTIEPGSAWDFIDAADARQQALQQAPAVVVFGSLAMRSPASSEAINAVLGASAALRFVDLNLRETPELQTLAAQALKLADWVKVNDEELDRLLAWFVCDGPLPPEGPVRREALTELAARFSVQRWIVTCGERGWFALNSEGRRDAAGLAPAVPRLVDTVGAGDAFSAVVVAGFAAHWPLARSLKGAAQLAAAVCGLRGALPDDAAFFDHWRCQLGLVSPAARAASGLIG